MRVTEGLALYEMHKAPMNKSTCKNYRWAVSSLVKVVGDLDVSYLGLDHILIWKASMRQEGVLATSINTQLAKIRCILRFLDKQEFRVLDYSKITREKEVYQPKTWLLPEEIDQLIRAAKTVRDKAIIKIYFATGGRLSEIRNLDRNNIEEAPPRMIENRIVYKLWVCGKGDKYRPVFIDDATKEYVDAYLETREDCFKPLFMSAQNNRLGGSTIEKMLHKTARSAGLDKHVTPHVLRHSFTSDLAVRNAPVLGISKLLGHARVSTTMNIYAHITDTQAESVYAAHKSR